MLKLVMAKVGILKTGLPRLWSHQSQVQAKTTIANRKACFGILMGSFVDQMLLSREFYNDV